MILRRIGNKSKVAREIISHFPPHKIFIEMFFGAGGIFFNKPLAEYSILNDIDSDVINLFICAKDKRGEMINLLKSTPLSEDIFYYWVENLETDPVKKAVRFLYISSFSYLGKNGTFRILHSDTSFKIKLESLILKTSPFFQKCLFRNKDFRCFLSDIQESEAHIPNRHRFIYADPPYLGTSDNYSDSFTEQDTTDLFKILVESNIRFGLSEFDNPIILDLASDYKLNVLKIGERRNLKNRRNEILVTNYQKRQMELFSFNTPEEKSLTG